MIERKAILLVIMHLERAKRVASVAKLSPDVTSALDEAILIAAPWRRK